MGSLHASHANNAIMQTPYTPYGDMGTPWDPGPRTPTYYIHRYSCHNMMKIIRLYSNSGIILLLLLCCISLSGYDCILYEN